MSFLNFEKAPVSQEAITAALNKAKAEREERQALQYATDVEACQRVVDNGKKKLKEFRRVADEFHKEFKKLEAATNVTEFVEILQSLPQSVRCCIGSVDLQGDYDTE